MFYDLIILGGGPAGYLAAERAGHAGLNVLLIEKRFLGGVCLNEGCIPSKALLHSAKVFDYDTVDPASLVEAEEIEYIKTKDTTPAERMEHSVLLSGFITILGVVYLVHHFYTNGFDLSLNIVNLIFLILGIAFHKTPINYVNAIGNAVKGAGGVILQFPFYAGIMGMMTGQSASGSSLAGVISEGFVSISTVRTFPLFTFWSAGIVNFCVPSGGGQWAVQGPIMMPASVKLGVDPAKTGLAIAWGDAWTNMIQPFWALPALGVAGLGARDIMGYCIMVLLYTGVILSVGLLFI